MSRRGRFSTRSGVPARDRPRVRRVAGLVLALAIASSGRAEPPEPPGTGPVPTSPTATGTLDLPVPTPLPTEFRPVSSSPSPRSTGQPAAQSSLPATAAAITTGTPILVSVPGTPASTERLKIPTGAAVAIVPVALPPRPEVAFPAAVTTAPLLSRYLSLDRVRFHPVESVQVRLVSTSTTVASDRLLLTASQAALDLSSEPAPAILRETSIGALAAPTWPIPLHSLPLGDYSVRLYRASKLLDSVAFTLAMDPSGMRLALDRSVFHPEEPIRLDLTRPQTFSQNAWVGLLPAEAPHAHSVEAEAHDLAFRFLRDLGTGSWTLPAPKKPGRYAFRVLDALPIAGVEFTVAVRRDGIDPRIEPASAKPGELVTLRFTRMAYLSDGSWWGLVPASAPHGDEAAADAHDLAYVYLRDARDGSWTFRAPTTPGGYELRLLDRGFELLAASFEVVP